MDTYTHKLQIMIAGSFDLSKTDKTKTEQEVFKYYHERWESLLTYTCAEVLKNHAHTLKFDNNCLTLDLFKYRGSDDLLKIYDLCFTLTLCGDVFINVPDVNMPVSVINDLRNEIYNTLKDRLTNRFKDQYLRVNYHCVSLTKIED